MNNTIGTIHNPIITGEGLVKTYQKSDQSSLTVLKGIDIRIPSEYISVIVGPSGAGKSTLLHILGGLDKADKGRVTVLDKDISVLNDNKLSEFRNLSLGFVFQFHHLLPEFTAEENIMMPLLIAGKSHKESAQKAKELLNLVGLENRHDHKPSELSGGEQQRVALARALANDPKIILADEPTGNLDSVNSDILNRLFIRLRDEFKKTLLIVTHNPELVKIADHIFTMKDGLLTDTESRL
ncbi:MAG: ABC transporter ATP-binding protein [Ignavibacteriaceae bacterium]|nr:ABC transporter ATP-binding protein [Ignavibacteriaceae bacterium]